MDNLSTIERMKNTPPEDNGFICYCDACEAQYGSHMVDDETGLTSAQAVKRILRQRKGSGNVLICCTI